MKIQFVKSAASISDFPDSEKPEVAVVGRSNCGKSSLINALWNAKVAKTSSTPGRTALVNFFDVGNVYRVVDTPGYGYAKGPANKIGAAAIEQYLNYRFNLVGVILLMDVRRDWSEEENMVIGFLEQKNTPWLLAPTKVDKLGKNDQQKRLKKLQAESKAPKLIPVSSLKKTGLKEVEEYLFKTWITVSTTRE